jgi:hypothetical protein
MRGRSGRFGVDHSEILNYELELANRARDEHMNHLVYKGDNPNDEPEHHDPTDNMMLPHNISTS